MEWLTSANLGNAVGAIAVVYIFATNLPKVISSIKNVKDGINPGEDLRMALDNNTRVVSELTQFLQTQNAVDKEKEKMSSQQWADINAKVDAIATKLDTKSDAITEKIDTIHSLVSVHATKCDSSCRK